MGSGAELAAGLVKAGCSSGIVEIGCRVDNFMHFVCFKCEEMGKQVEDISNVVVGTRVGSVEQILAFYLMSFF